MPKPRNENGEIVRCILMFGICCMHACDYGLHLCAWWINCFYCFLDGFVLLSGWYGIRFTWRKFFSLWGIGLFCALIDAIAFNVCVLNKQPSVLQFISLVKDKMFSHWYLNCYAVLMLLAPLVNEAIERLWERRDRLASVLIPFFCLVFGWSWLVEKGARWFSLPRVAGLGSFTFLTLLGVYVVGRLCRKWELDQRIPLWLFIVLWGGGTVLCICGFGWYASPFTVIGAVGLFFTVLKIRWPRFVGISAVFLGPSVFSIYLLHEGPEGYWIVRHLDCDGIIGYLYIALILFVGGVVIDVALRRIPLAIIGRWGGRK